MIERIDKYNLRVNGVEVAAPEYTDIEERLRSMTPEQQEMFARIFSAKEEK